MAEVKRKYTVVKRWSTAWFKFPTWQLFDRYSTHQTHCCGWCGKWTNKTYWFWAVIYRRFLERSVCTVRSELESLGLCMESMQWRFLFPTTFLFSLFYHFDSGSLAGPNLLSWSRDLRVSLFYANIFRSFVNFCFACLVLIHCNVGHRDISLVFLVPSSSFILT